MKIPTTQARYKILRLVAVLIALVILNATIYLIVAGQLGFPLDDAWIHQVFARNIGLYGEIAFGV